MISEDECLERVMAAVPHMDAEPVALEDAWGRVAAASVFAQTPLPGFDNSAMDGYAIHPDNCGQSGVRLRVTGAQPAGADRALRVRPGEAVRIFTGAPLPAGTGAVVMQEDVEADGDGILVREPARPGEFIRRAGADVAAGQLLVSAGETLTPQRIGVLAAQGLAQVSCGRLPRAIVLTTGDELTRPGSPLPHPGALYNSNGPMLAALLQSQRIVQSVPTLTVRDDPAALTTCLRRCLDQCDAIVLAGGVSVGEHDYVKPALEGLGLKPDLWRVRVKPGKPFLFVAAPGGKLVFGLPGNPVSAFVTAHLFVLPALRRMAGATNPVPPLISATTTAPLPNKGDRPHYVRGVFDAAAASFSPCGTQESHAIAGLSASNALARLEPQSAVAAGERVLVRMI